MLAIAQMENAKTCMEQNLAIKKLTTSANNGFADLPFKQHTISGVLLLYEQCIAVSENSPFQFLIEGLFSSAKFR